MIQYEHIGGNRRSATMTDIAAEASIGGRIMSGFECWQDYVVDPNGHKFSLVVFQNEVTGNVWAIYFDVVSL